MDLFDFLFSMTILSLGVLGLGLLGMIIDPD